MVCPSGRVPDRSAYYKALVAEEGNPVICPKCRTKVHVKEDIVQIFRYF
jgi:hypothetical protein